MRPVDAPIFPFSWKAHSRYLQSARRRRHRNLSGYMDTSTFYRWFANHFIPNLPPARPVVLLVDGHDSHLNLELFQLAGKNGIYLYSLLQNATHLVQPADVGLFGPLKRVATKKYDCLLKETRTRTSIRKTFAQCSKQHGKKL